MDLDGKVAVVTGAGNGIGRAVALALADAGADVALVDIEAEAAADVASMVRARGGRSASYVGDVRDPEAVSSLASEVWSRFGAVNVLVNNAGVIAATGPVWETQPRDVEWVLGVNVEGIFNGLRAFVPRMIDSGEDAWIVNTGSEHSLGLPHAGAGVYNASKHAVLGLSETLRAELPDHIGVSVLCPGIVESTLWRATERRPDALGGAVGADARGAEAMAQGLAAEAVAERVVEAIRAEYFYVLTHPHVVDYAERRWQEIEAAFARQAPRYDGDSAYDVNAIIERLAGRRD